MSNLTLKITVNSQEAKLGSQLNSKLGQHQINVNDFIIEFNYKSSNLLEGLPIRVIIYKFEKLGNFVQLKLCGPTLSYLFLNLIVIHEIKINMLFDIILIFWEFNNKCSFVRIISQVFGFIKSKKIKIII